MWSLHVIKWEVMFSILWGHSVTGSKFFGFKSKNYTELQKNCIKVVLSGARAWIIISSNPGQKRIRSWSMIDSFSKFDTSYVKRVRPFQHEYRATKATAHSGHTLTQFRRDVFERCARKIAPTPVLTCYWELVKVFQSMSLRGSLLSLKVKFIIPTPPS